ncbi:MAG: hypothetical protein H6581_30895 [Bacteroidia bacterium]|nr:hypothetical protein [Bacteroidia bacterium]
MKKVIFLVADQDIKSILEGILQRFPQVWGIPQFQYEIYKHQNRDSGCVNTGVDFLRPFCKIFDYSFIVFDREGSGKESQTSIEIESNIEAGLSANGWNSRGFAIAIDPEVENWVWADSKNIFDTIGWGGQQENLLAGLEDAGFKFLPNGKPERPKEALVWALKIKKKVFNAAIHKEIGQSASFLRCTDPAFLKLKDIFTNRMQLS